MGAHTSMLSEGDFFLIDLGSLHGYRNGEETEIVNCMFSPEYVDRALINSPSIQAVLSTGVRQFGVSVLGSCPADRILHDEDGKIRQLVEAMEQEYIKQDAGYLELVRCYLIEILVHILRRYSSGVTDRCHPVIASIANDLQNTYSQPLSLTDLGMHYGYTPQYLSQLFHRETGMSLTAYLQKIRIEKSCQLLSKTNLHIAEIGRQVGYEDTKHFNTVFRRYMGMSPRELRALQKGTNHSNMP